MCFFLWEKTTNKGYILQRGTILGGGVPKKVSTLFAPLRYIKLKKERLII